MFKKIAFSITAIILLLMGAVFLFAEDIEISVSENEAQSAIDDFLIKESQNNRGIRITPKSISLDFKATNSAEITSDLTIDGYGYSGEFDGKFATGINYRRPKLYLDQLSLIEGGFSTDESTQSELDNLKKASIDVLERQRNSRETENLEILSDNSDRTSTELVEEFIMIATRTFFENIPVYDVASSGKTGMAASLALKNVRFTEDTAIITFSPVTALLRILAALGFVCLVIAWFIGPRLISWFFSRLIQADRKK